MYLGDRERERGEGREARCRLITCMSNRVLPPLMSYVLNGVSTWEERRGRGEEREKEKEGSDREKILQC